MQECVSQQGKRGRGREGGGPGQVVPSTAEGSMRSPCMTWHVADATNGCRRRARPRRRRSCAAGRPHRSRRRGRGRPASGQGPQRCESHARPPTSSSHIRAAWARSGMTASAQGEGRKVAWAVEAAGVRLSIALDQDCGKRRTTATSSSPSEAHAAPWAHLAPAPLVEVGHQAVGGVENHKGGHTHGHEGNAAEVVASPVTETASVCSVSVRQGTRCVPLRLANTSINYSPPAARSCSCGRRGGSATCKGLSRKPRWPGQGMARAGRSRGAEGACPCRRLPNPLKNVRRTRLSDRRKPRITRAPAPAWA
eukprot:364815-Chlamydomonas_euryale.AAC.7